MALATKTSISMTRLIMMPTTTQLKSAATLGYLIIAAICCSKKAQRQCKNKQQPASRAFCIQTGCSCCTQSIDPTVESICFSLFHYRDCFQVRGNSTELGSGDIKCSGFKHDQKRKPKIGYLSCKKCITLILRVNYGKRGQPSNQGLQFFNQIKHSLVEIALAFEKITQYFFSSIIPCWQQMLLAT